MIPNKHSLLQHQTRMAKQADKRVSLLGALFCAAFFYAVTILLAVSLSTMVVTLFDVSPQHKLFIFFVVIYCKTIILLTWLIYPIVLEDDSKPTRTSLNPANDAYAQITELSDMLENRDVKDGEILRIVDEVREKMRKERAR